MGAATADLAVLYQDLSACLLTLANVLEAKTGVTKADIAAAAQERLLVLTGIHTKEATDRLMLLRMLAMVIERRPAD